MTKKKEIELARKFFDLIFREVENGEDVIYDFINPECRYKTLCDKLNNETVKEVLELGFKQKYGEEWHGGNVDPLYDAKAVGNAAAMREALVKCMELGKKINESLGNDESTVWNCRYERSFANSIVEIAKSALASPPRNCDRFDDLNSAQRHYIEHGCPKGLGMLVDGEIRKAPWKSQFEKWLFTPTTERKGETDGSK